MTRIRLRYLRSILLGYNSLIDVDNIIKHIRLVGPVNVHGVGLVYYRSDQTYWVESDV